MRHTRVAALLLVATAAATRSADAQTSNQFWPELDVYHSLSSVFRVMGLASLRTKTKAADDVRLGLHLDYLGMRYGWARVGYRFIFTPDAPTRESRELAELTLEGSGFGVGLENRVRVELREINGELSTRARERIRFDHRVGPPKGLHFDPFVNAEIFYDSRRNFPDWARVRYQAGVEIEKTSPVRVELAYTRQNDWLSHPDRVNAIALKVELRY